MKPEDIIFWWFVEFVVFSFLRIMRKTGGEASANFASPKKGTLSLHEFWYFNIIFRGESDWVNKKPYYCSTPDTLQVLKSSGRSLFQKVPYMFQVPHKLIRDIEEFESHQFYSCKLRVYRTLREISTEDFKTCRVSGVLQ